MMLSWFQSLDRVLRGDATSPEAIRKGGVDLPLRGLCIVGVLLAMFYGACMGSFAIFREVDPRLGQAQDRYWQLLATTLKVPALFFLTLLITTPSLYVFNALVGSRLRLLSMLRLLIGAMGVNLAVLASFGPIVAFFSVSTPSHDFMLLFNVLMFIVAGCLGLAFLVQTLNRLSIVQQRQQYQQLKDIAKSPAIQAALVEERVADLGDRLVGDSADPPANGYSSSDHANVTSQANADVPSNAFADSHSPDLFGTAKPIWHATSTHVATSMERSERPGALDTADDHVLSRHVTLVFRCWIMVYGLVGAQMGWVLRPFIGDPSLPFTWFRDRESNFFEAILRTLGNFLGIGS